jgi:hypothetical protein
MSSLVKGCRAKAGVEEGGGRGRWWRRAVESGRRTWGMGAGACGGWGQI